VAASAGWPASSATVAADSVVAALPIRKLRRVPEAKFKERVMCANSFVLRDERMQIADKGLAKLLGLPPRPLEQTEPRRDIEGLAEARDVGVARTHYADAACATSR
jgi:hypothetical protein